jgi:hypothetical protein
MLLDRDAGIPQDARELVAEISVREEGEGQAARS